MTKLSVLFISTVGLAACGGSPAAGPDAAPIDAPAGPLRAVVVAGDFTEGHPGVLSVLELATKTVVKNGGPPMAVGDDPMLRHIGGELLIVNRADGNNVTILDDQTLGLKEQLATGAGSNPQDVAVVGDRLYVATFGGKGVTVLTRHSTVTKQIDLSVDDPDGKPNCNSVYLVGTSLYVSCELLDDSMMFLPPRGPGKVYVVDTATDTVKQTLTLGHKNPFGVFEQIPPHAPNAGDLVIPTVFFDDGSGCVERVVPGATATAPGCLVTNADLGGYASRLSFEDDPSGAIGFFAVPGVYPKSDLRAFDMPTGLLWAGPLNATAEAIGDVVVCPTGQLVVSDTTKNVNGLRIYNGGTELTTAVLPVGLPPSSTHGLVCY